MYSVAESYFLFGYLDSEGHNMSELVVVVVVVVVVVAAALLQAQAFGT